MSAAGTAVQQNENQRREINYQNQVTKVTQANAAKAAANDYVAMAEQSMQVQQAAAQEANAAVRENVQAKGALAVGAAAAGLQGGSVNDLRYTLAIQAAEDAAVRTRNLDWQQAQINRSIERINVEQQNRANSRFLGAIPGIDYASLIGNLGSALGSYGVATTRNKV
ncbi:MAG: hypothetical protein H6590_06030 [Flavobacteriales bacterium]|nr:hypothetical protein [Flavobacteriales bacterium]